MKVFNNGKIQMTGLIDEQQIHKVLYIFIKECNTLSEKVFIDNDNPKIIYSDIVLINSDFDIGFPINREILYRYLIRDGYFCTYEPCQYPGINIKYYNNVLNNNGICNCTEVCDGKGNCTTESEYQKSLQAKDYKCKYYVKYIWKESERAYGKKQYKYTEEKLKKINALKDEGKSLCDAGKLKDGEAKLEEAIKIISFTMLN